MTTCCNICWSVGCTKFLTVWVNLRRPDNERWLGCITRYLSAVLKVSEYLFMLSTNSTSKPHQILACCYGKSEHISDDSQQCEIVIWRHLILTDWHFALDNLLKQWICKKQRPLVTQDILGFIWSHRMINRNNALYPSVTTVSGRE